MSRKIFKTKLIQLNYLTPSVRELVLKPEEPFHFKAGEFVMLQIPKPEGDTSTRPLQRAYSLASAQQVSTEFRLIIKLVDNGVASGYVGQMTEGDEVLFTGPFGKMHFKEPAPQQALLLSTGAGLSQHYSYLASELHRQTATQFHLFFGVRSSQDIFYQNELDDLVKKYPNFKYTIVLSRPTESWKGSRGYVHHFLNDFDVQTTITHVYCCGSPDMIKDVKKYFIEGKGFDAKSLLAEAFH